MTLKEQKGQAAANKMISAIDAFRIKGGDADGLIPHSKSELAITRAMTAFCSEYIDTANQITSLKTDNIVIDTFTDLIDLLENAVFTGKIKTTLDKNGNVTKTPITKSPRNGLNFYDDVIGRVTAQLLANWKPKTPKLKHNPDTVRFLEICRDLFPNVVEPHVAANGFREFIENVHSSCDENPNGPAKFLQKALWLFSYRTGGTGKSFFMEMLKDACDELHLDTAYEVLQDSGYINPTIGMHTITICEDTKKLSDDTAALMNNIIDQKIFHYNIKYGAQGTTQSFANLVVGSNFVSYEQNTRRYNEVEYVQRNIQTALTNQDRAEYFPLWDNKAQGIAEIIEAFEVCPFRCEHDVWEQPIITNDLFGEEPKQRFKVNVRNIQLVLNIYDTIEAYTYEPIATYNISKMRPNEFARLMEHYGVMKRDAAIKALIPFLTEMRTTGKLRANMTAVEFSYFNWTEIADMIPSADETETNFLATIRDEWNALIEEARKEVI